MFRVENIEVDLCKYEGSLCIQVLAEYVHSHKLCLIAKRIDTMSNEGWPDDIEVLLHDFVGNVKTVRIGSSMEDSTKRLENIDMPDSTLICSRHTIESSWQANYRPFQRFEHYPLHIGRDEFNDIFRTDIVELPSCLYAVGMKDGGCYIHHEAHDQYTWGYEIEQTIDFLISVVFAKTPGQSPLDFYCIVCALDGYIEACYPTTRDTAKQVGPSEYHNISNIDISSYSDSEYPVFHYQKYILGQSVRKHIPYTIPIVDRYYLCLHRYNQYRSVHQGIPFHTKIAKLVYAGNTRGSIFNFMKDNGIRISQRAYFASDAVDKTNIVCPPHLSREEMIQHKYILDIDGNACTWDATAWKLNSGSVIFKPESDWKQWFYDEYLPWKHYVPIKDDFSDIQERIDWCESNQDKCIEMVSSCKALFQDIYKHTNVVKAMERVVDTLVEAQRTGTRPIQ